MEKENNYQSLIDFIVVWNNLAKYSELNYEILNGYLYIDGMPQTLGALFSALWSVTGDYCLYFENKEGKNYIKALKIER